MKTRGGSRISKTPKKMGGPKTSDIISNLPCNVLDQILMCLPLQDAARTSILSRKWRYIWAKLPQLVFDDEFCGEAIRKLQNKLILTIYQVMVLHRGPILKFTLSLAELESSSDFDQLILVASNNGVQDFTLHVLKGEPYQVPSSLFSCLQITSLNLDSCIWKPPPGFKGFNKLLCLEFSEVVITGGMLSHLISSCPLLERITLSSSSSFNHLKIVAPNLRFLLLLGNASSISFENTPRLATVSIKLISVPDYDVEVEASNSVFSSLTAIESLDLDYYYTRRMTAGGVSKRATTTFSHLKILKLQYICFTDLEDVSGALWIIRSSPNLEKLSIMAFLISTEETDAIGSVLQLLEVQGCSDLSLNHLREVELVDISGECSELGFIKLLLAQSPKLERMVIKPESTVVMDKELKILKGLTGFRRSSTRVEISYKSPGEVKV